MIYYRGQKKHSEKRYVYVYYLLNVLTYKKESRHLKET